MEDVKQPDQRPLWFTIISVIAVVFGLITVVMGAQVLFVDGSVRAFAGNYVPFIVWFNFIVGFFYVIAGIGLWFMQYWAARLSMAIALASMAAFAALGVHILMDGVFEFRTLAAMLLRSFIWVAIAFTACRTMLPARATSLPDPSG